MKFLKYILVILLLYLINAVSISPVKAIVNPQASQNNKFGIHIISPTIDESSPAASLVNSGGGDWGYITILIESKNRDHNKWQAFFDDLRRRHLIPIIRLATEPEKDYWKRPYEGEEIAWADFLDNLNWPVKNRYVLVYNEPNQGQEWGGSVDPASYARVLDKTITALKNKSNDFFVLNAGFDASAPEKAPNYMDEVTFLTQMDRTVPGILNRLDGWTSHSYPNPGFVGSPNAAGRGTVKTWIWENQILNSLGVTKLLPVFITETGWKHAEGIYLDKSLPSADIIGDYYQSAYATAWSNNRIIAVTPFLLNYQEAPFDHFSFKKITGETQNIKILGISSDSNYYPFYQSMMDIPKISGKPAQDQKAELVKGEIYSSLVSGENYDIYLTFKNTGQSIWNDVNPIELRALLGAKELQIETKNINPDQKVEPGQETTFDLKLKAPINGSYTVSLQLYSDIQEFNTAPFVFITTVKSPVELSIKSGLQWKKDYSGNYILTVSSNPVTNSTGIILNSLGESQKIEAKYLLPDYTFNFTLQKPFYKPKTISIKVKPGNNILDFGVLEPDLLSALFRPNDLWQLTPFSN